MLPDELLQILQVWIWNFGFLELDRIEGFSAISLMAIDRHIDTFAIDVNIEEGAGSSKPHSGEVVAGRRRQYSRKSAWCSVHGYFVSR